MRTCLTEMSWTMTMPLVGETEAGSAQVQPVRDSRTKATDGRRDDGVMPVIPSSPIPSRAFLCLKKPPRRRRGKELIVKGVCPFHAEPLQSSPRKISNCHGVEAKKINILVMSKF